MVSKSKRKRKHSVAKKVKVYMKEYIPLILIVFLCLILLIVTAATRNWYGVWVGTSRNMTHYHVGLWDYTSEETERKDIRVEILFNDFGTMGPVMIIVLFLHLATKYMLIIIHSKYYQAIHNLFSNIISDCKHCIVIDCGDNIYQVLSRSWEQNSSKNRLVICFNDYTIYTSVFCFIFIFLYDLQRTTNTKTFPAKIEAYRICF